MTVPAWTRLPTTVWIADRARPDPRIPAGAVVLTPDEAIAWLDEPGRCPALAELRARGATAVTAKDAPKELRSLARRVRALLAVGDRGALATVAEELHAPRLAAALREWPSDAPTTFANLSTAAAGPERLDDTARILLALEHL